MTSREIISPGMLASLQTPKLELRQDRPYLAVRRPFSGPEADPATAATQLGRLINVGRGRHGCFHAYLRKTESNAGRSSPVASLVFNAVNFAQVMWSPGQHCPVHLQLQVRMAAHVSSSGAPRSCVPSTARNHYALSLTPFPFSLLFSRG